MNKISTGQLTAALLLSNAFMLMCVKAPLGMEYSWGLFISFAVQAVLCIPMIMLYRKGFSLTSYCNEKHYVIPCLFALYFILRGGISFLLVWNGSKQLSLPFSEPLITAVLIGMVCLYTASLGLSAFARTSTVVFGVLVLSLIILITGAWERTDAVMFSHTAENTIAGSAFRNLSVADSLPALFILLEFTKNKSTVKNLLFLPLGLLLWEIVIFLCITVLGSLLNAAPYPFFLMTGVSQPLTEQRADAVYLILFVLLCILRITLMTVLSAHILGMVFPKLRFRSIISVFLMIGAAAGFGAVNFTGNVICITGIVIFAFLIPLVFYLRLNKHNSWKEETGT